MIRRGQTNFLATSCGWELERGSSRGVRDAGAHSSLWNNEAHIALRFDSKPAAEAQYRLEELPRLLSCPLARWRRSPAVEQHDHIHDNRHDAVHDGKNHALPRAWSNQSTQK